MEKCCYILFSTFKIVERLRIYVCTTFPYRGTMEALCGQHEIPHCHCQVHENELAATICAKCANNRQKTALFDHPLWCDIRLVFTSTQWY